jgi:hypothetical protein
MTEEQKRQLQLLQVQFRQYFLGGSEDFDINRYLNDPSYSQLIQTQLERDPSRQDSKNQALQSILNFYQTLNSSPDLSNINVQGIFRPLQEKIPQLAEQSRREGLTDVSQQFEGAEKRATEALAGTGLGRSGAGVGVQLGVQRERSRAVERLLNNIRTEQVRSELAVTQKISELEFQKQMVEAGMEFDFIQSALQHQRTLEQITHQGLVQAALQPESDWWDQYVMPLLDLGGTLVGSF